MNKNLLLIGGGGHAKSVIDSLSFSKAYNKIGIVDNSQEIGSSINGIEVVGKDANLKKLRHEGYTHAFVTVGSVGSTVLRRKLTNLILENDFLIPNIIDKTANISDLANIGYGNFIGKFTIINANVKIGNNNIMNSG